MSWLSPRSMVRSITIKSIVTLTLGAGRSKGRTAEDRGSPPRARADSRGHGLGRDIGSIRTES